MVLVLGNIIVTAFCKIAADRTGAPRRLRATHGHLRDLVEAMIGWAPERVILADGRWYERDGTTELRRAFREGIAG